MADIPKDVQANYTAFSTNFPTQLESNIAAFRGNTKLLESYARVAGLNALKLDLIKHNFPKGAAQFFYEAHNDALLSHAHASFGSWRPALQSLRSFVENTLASVYYLDHPVEFTKWASGAFKISPRELREYVVEHPKVLTVAKEIGLKDKLDQEYSTLSKAVHGSNSLFRMTSSDGKTNLASATLPDLGKWSARERTSVDLCVTILASILQEHLDGAKVPELRRSLASTLQTNSRAALKKHLKINI